jgi:hypothetical protein
MSYIKAITISEYDYKVNQVNVEQLQSVTQYLTNVTVDESQSMNLAMNVSLVESQPIYSQSNDFNWTAIDNPSEMNYCSNDCSCPDCTCSFLYILLFLSMSGWPFLFLVTLAIFCSIVLRKDLRSLRLLTHMLIWNITSVAVSKSNLLSASMTFG